MATFDFFATVDEFRQNANGWDASQPLDILLPSLRTVRREIITLISQDTWDTLKTYHEDPPAQEDEVKARAVELVQSALANLIMRDYFVFIAVGKNKTDGDIFKYQYDDIRTGYGEAAWSSMNQLMEFMDANEQSFSGYTDTPAYQERQSLIIKSYQEFERYFGIDNSPWFFTKLVFLIKEVTDDEILPRITEWEAVSENVPIAEKVKRALVYHTMYLALDRFDFTSLPGTIRSQAGNEGNRTIQTRYSDDQAKLLLASKLRDKARAYFVELGLMMKNLSTDGIIEPTNLNEDDTGFYQMT